MKILYIIHDNRKGGAAVSFLNMIKGVKSEHEVCVLTPHKKGYIPDELDRLGIWHKNAHYFWWEIAKVGNPRVDVVRFLIYKILNVYNRFEAGRLAGKVKKMGIDVIHSNSSAINIGALISEITGIPHVWHLRELALPEYPLYPARKKDTLRSVLNTGNNTYVAISEYAAKFYEKYIEGDTGGRIRVIYNGIDSSYDYRKSPDEYGRDKVSFLVTGNYSEEKGQINVAQAAGLLVEKGVTNFKVYMAGRGDFAQVHEYVSQNGLEDYVVFCGLVDDMLSLRKKCDVEVVASMMEAFGRVTVEAMRSSNPVVGSATGGTTELIEDGVTGFLYEYKDNEALAERMQRFIDDPSLAYKMGSRAYEWSVGRFTSEENIEKVLELYAGISSPAGL